MKRQRIRKHAVKSTALNHWLGKLVTALLLCLAVSLSGGAVGMAASSHTSGENATALEARNGVVRILAINTDGTSAATGSGFAVGTAGEASDIFVTNWHVVTDDDGAICSYIYLLLGDDAVVRDSSGGLRIHDQTQMVRCQVLGNPVQYPDFAILQAERVVTERTALPLLSADQVEPLEPVFAFGYPASAEYLNNGEYLYADIDSVIATSGTIMRIEEVARYEGTRVVIHGAEINHGNSGGPLVTSDGAVIGINTYGISADGSNYYCAVAIDYVMEELAALGISYEVFDPDAEEPLPGWVAPAAVAGCVLVLAGIGAAVRMQQKKKKREAAQARHMAEQMEKIGEAMNQVQREAAAARQDVWEAKRQAQASIRMQGTDSGYRLRGMSGTFAGRQFVIGQRMRIGREAGSNELVYPADTRGVSGRHCELVMQGGRLYLMDVGSSYGTFYKNRKLQPNQPVPLQPGDLFYLAHSQECFRIEAAPGRDR